MAITYSKEKFYRTGDTTELTFASFFNFIDEFVQSNAIRSGPKYRIHNQLALYSKKEREVIVLYTFRTTSDNDTATNISKCIKDLLTKDSNYDYYVAATNTMIEGATSEDKGKSYPGIQLYGEDGGSEDRQEEKTKRKVYRINFGVPQPNIIGLEWLHEVKLR